MHLSNNNFEYKFCNIRFMQSKDAMNVLYKINKFVCIVFCIWMISPYIQYKMGMRLGILVSLLWIISTGSFLLLKKWSWDLALVPVFFITLVPYIVTDTFQYSSFNKLSVLGTFYLFLIGIFMNHYYLFYKKDYKFMGKIVIIALFTYIVSSLQTYFGLLHYPGASRMLAVGGLSPELIELYSSKGIGGFGFVYSTCFICIMTIYPVIKKTPLSNKNKLLCLFSFAVFIIMILKASYAIAILITFIGIISVIIFKGKKTFILLMIFSLIIFLIIPQSIFGEIFLKIANIFSNNHTVSEKLMDLSNSFLPDAGGQQTSKRLNLYVSSLNTFFRQPMFGIYGPFGDPVNSTVGGHSGWLDLMAYYGLFTSIPLFVAIYLCFRKNLKFVKHSNNYGLLFIVQIIFLGFGLINPILYVYQIGFAVFFIVPTIPFLPYTLGSTKQDKYELKKGDNSL